MCWQRLCECVIVIRHGSDKSVDSGKTELFVGVCWLQQAHLSVDLKRLPKLGKSDEQSREKAFKGAHFQAISPLSRFFVVCFSVPVGGMVNS